MRVQALSYCYRLNAVLGDEQAWGEYFGGLSVRGGEDAHSLHLGDDNSDEQRGGWTPPTEGVDPRDIVVVVSPSPGPS